LNPKRAAPPPPARSDLDLFISDLFISSRHKNANRKNILNN